MTQIKKTLRTIDNFFSWWPHNFLRYSYDQKYVEYDQPNISGSFLYIHTDFGYYSYKHVYTKIDDFLSELPGIISFLMFLIGMLTLYPLFFLIKLPWMIIKHFLPKKWFLDWIEQEYRKIRWLYKKNLFNLNYSMNKEYIEGIVKKGQ